MLGVEGLDDEALGTLRWSLRVWMAKPLELYRFLVLGVEGLDVKPLELYKFLVLGVEGLDGRAFGTQRFSWDGS